MLEEARAARLELAYGPRHALAFGRVGKRPPDPRTVIFQVTEFAGCRDGAGDRRV